jgi:hypothetical protein
VAELVELDKAHGVAQQELVHLRDEVLTLRAALAAAHAQIALADASGDDPSAALRAQLATHSKRVVELEHALGIVFAPRALEAPRASARASAFHTLCKVMTGESVALAAWTGHEGKEQTPARSRPTSQDGPFGALPPGLRSLDLLRSVFDIATATNGEVTVGLMDAAQLADATAALARELSPAAATTEAVGAKAAYPLKGLSVAQAASAMARVAHVAGTSGSGSKAAVKSTSSNAAGAPGHIEFVQFVVVCVHYLASQEEISVF